MAFVSVTQPIDTTSSIGRLMRSILMDFAQFEREMISERTRDKMVAMARKGKRTGGWPIIGFDIDAENKKLNINNVESKQVKEMFATYLKTQSLSATAQTLNEKGYRMKAWTTKKGFLKGGQKFNKANLWYLLQNPLYVGKISFRKEIFPGEHSAIISDDIFSQAQKLRNSNGDGKKYKKIKERTHTFLLKGLVRCAACQTTMTPCSALPRKQERFYYYKCLSVIKQNKSACQVRSVSAKALEEFVIKRLRQLSENQTIVDRIVNQAQCATNGELPIKNEEKKLLSAELGKIELEAKNLVSVLAEEGPQSRRRAFISERLDELETRREELRSKLLLLNAELQHLEMRQLDPEVIRKSLGNFLLMFAKIPDQEKAELAGILMREILFDGLNNKVSIKLRPLPDMWSDVTTLEGVFYDRKRWLP